MKVPHWSATVKVGMLKFGSRESVSTTVLHLETGDLGMEYVFQNSGICLTLGITINLPSLHRII